MTSVDEGNLSTTWMWPLVSVESQTYSTIATSLDSNQGQANICLTYKYINAVVMVIISLFGILGNTMTVVTMWNTIKKNATAFLLVMLAFFDSGVLVVWMTILGVPSICSYVGGCIHYFRWSFAYIWTYLWPIGTWFHNVGTWLVVVVTFHRYLAVCVPHQVARLGSPKMARCQVVVVCIAMFLYVLPRVFDEKVVTKEDGSGNTRVLTAMGRHKILYDIVYATILHYIIIYVLPFGALILMTYKLIVSHKEHRAKIKMLSRSKREEIDLTLTLLVVVFIFMVCQLTNPIRRLLVAVYPREERGCGSVYSFYQPISSNVLILNNATNFIVYCVFSRRFRRNLRVRLHRLIGRGSKVEPSTTGMNNTLETSNSIQLDVAPPANLDTLDPGP